MSMMLTPTHAHVVLPSHVLSPLHDVLMLSCSSPDSFFRIRRAHTRRDHHIGLEKKKKEVKGRELVLVLFCFVLFCFVFRRFSSCLVVAPSSTGRYALSPFLFLVNATSKKRQTPFFFFKSIRKGNLDDKFIHTQKKKKKKKKVKDHLSSSTKSHVELSAKHTNFRAERHQLIFIFFVFFSFPFVLIPDWFFFPSFSSPSACCSATPASCWSRHRRSGAGDVMKKSPDSTASLSLFFLPTLIQVLTTALAFRNTSVCVATRDFQPVQTCMWYAQTEKKVEQMSEKK